MELNTCATIKYGRGGLESCRVARVINLILQAYAKMNEAMFSGRAGTSVPLIILYHPENHLPAGHNHIESLRPWPVPHLPTTAVINFQQYI